MSRTLFLLLLGCGPNVTYTGQDGDTSADACGDDAAPGASPENPEVCDGLDDDCDGAIDEGVLGVYHPDADGDGFGDVLRGVEACSPPAGHTPDGSDCDDADPAIHPDAAEVCDARDNDCDGARDEGLTLTAWVDADGDGYGDTARPQWVCALDAGLSAVDGDCDDADPAVNPDAEEVCDGVDNDCDGQTDEAGRIWYADRDYDGYGDPASPVEGCDQPPGAVANADDCDDSSASTWPGADDSCDGVDSDCDGAVDEDHDVGWVLLTVHSDGVVYEVDTTTADMTPVSTLDLPQAAVSTSDVRDDGVAIIFNGLTGELMEMDACDGTTSAIGETGLASVGGIAFGAGGVLYGVSHREEALVQLDLRTGAGTIIGAGLGYDVGHAGMAWDCATDTLYVLDAAAGVVYPVDTTTGLPGPSVPLGFTFGSAGLEFDRATGLMWLSTGDDLYTLDPTTGVATFIGAFPEHHVNDLAFHPPCN
ncbi:MAG: putative metal-binding motif-containing protein [Alphaproteobacteria bacterium]|nr:putative metal-binding motif-containing protein [Alphaproteobacteria bacterium]